MDRIGEFVDDAMDDVWTAPHMGKFTGVTLCECGGENENLLIRLKMLEHMAIITFLGR